MKTLSSQKGFTLVEIIAVLIILGILAVIAVPRYIDLEANATQRAIEVAVREMTSREQLAWANTKITYTGYTGDASILSLLNQRPADAAAGVGPWLGAEYTWGGPASTGANTLTFKNTSVALVRTQSTETRPGAWSK